MMRWLVLSMALAAGCGTTAEVRTRDGRVLEGPILASDQRAVTVGAVTVERGDIATIDHPGNVLFISGIAAFANGVGTLALTRDASSDARGAALLLGGGQMVAGIALAMWGYEVWSGSVWRARTGRADIALSPSGGVFTARF